MSEKTVSAALIQAANQIEASMHLQPAEMESQPGTTLIAPAPSTSLKEGLSFVPKSKKVSASRSRALRLEQNRKAARESRRRKKKMVEELQRSLMFQQENEELTRKVLEAHNVLAKLGKPLPALDPKLVQAGTTSAPTTISQPSTAAVLAPVDLSFSQDITAMQPGATMQAMANFQQAAHAAMEAATRSMKAQGVVVPPEGSTASV